MTTLIDPARCLRPTCAFHVLPHLTEDDALSLFAYCSAACKEWTEEAVSVAQAPYSPAIERQAERLDALARLLDLRDHSSDVAVSIYARP
ncbi:hypothetical protein [Streptomyces sp. NPDC059743]|uniref:hypothetical protein n=1 Tax=Streptomyces sp. NPDC059743 TaxID=3346928 RepID=UPI00365CB132